MFASAVINELTWTDYWNQEKVVMDYFPIGFHSGNAF